MGSVMKRGVPRFAGRAGEKLDGALDAFGIDVRGAICADFGCHVGGFTDCLLQRGAARVYAVDTAYGVLAWHLRRSDRVVVMERTNALHCPAPEPVDLVTIDVGWTPQARIVPAAGRWLRLPRDGRAGRRIVSLLKPRYERAKMQAPVPRGPLGDAEAQRVCLAVSRGLSAGGCVVRAAMRSVLRGKAGGVEFFLLVAPPGEGDASAPGARPSEKTAESKAC